MTSTIGAYYKLTKPQRVYANLLVAAAGFAFASEGSFDAFTFAMMLAGLWGVVAGACVINNQLDSVMDAKMERTKVRATAQGSVSALRVYVFGTALFVVGLGLLWVYTTPTAAAFALLGFVSYVAVYTPLKSKTPHALWVGAISGATPPVVGYAAVTGSLDTAAWLLFAFLFVWQVAHFLAIAVYRAPEYAAAGVPMYFMGPFTDRQRRLARTVFYASLVVLVAWCGLLAVL